MKQKTNQTTVNRIDEILTDICGCSGWELSASESKKEHKRVKDALYKEIMRCVGEDEKLYCAKNSGRAEVEKLLQSAEEKKGYLYRNSLRSEIRKSIKDLFFLQDKGKE